MLLYVLLSWLQHEHEQPMRVKPQTVLRAKPVDRAERIESLWLLIMCLLWIAAPVLLGLAMKWLK